MKFTLDQYDYIIQYMNEHYFNFYGGNSKLIPALKEIEAFKKLVFQYIDPVGDKRTFLNTCKNLPLAFKKVIDADTVAIVDNFPYVTVVTEDYKIPIDYKGNRLTYAIETSDRVITAKEYATLYPNKAFKIQEEQ